MLGLDCKDISPSICYFILNIDRYDELLTRCMDDSIYSYWMSSDISLTSHASLMIERHHGSLTCTHHQDVIQVKRYGSL